MPPPIRPHVLASSLLFALIALAPSRALAVTPCGGEGQRACCLGERSGGACDSGLIEVSGCSGDCRCNSILPTSSSSTCKRLTPCGGDGQRACCLGERSGGACDSGLAEVAGCTGNCVCKGGLASSSGTCRLITPCGGAGQRACCVGERSGGACDPGLTEVSGCTGNCLCKGGLASASSSCKVLTPCGGDGQRACCVGERSGGACDSGLVEVSGCTGNCTCKGGLADSSGTCRVLTPCGGDGQRACCIGESDKTCAGDLVQQPGCTGNCVCKGGMASSSGTCRGYTHCGRNGERACCVGERAGPPCDLGLQEEEGCTGNCLCKGGGGLTNSSGTCKWSLSCLPCGLPF